MQKRLKENVQRAFLVNDSFGNRKLKVIERYVEEHYSPIYENGKMGITSIFIRRKHKKTT